MTRNRKTWKGKRMNNEVELLEVMQAVHIDLGVIASFLVFFVIVILLYFSYKFFDMFFKI